MKTETILLQRNKPQLVSLIKASSRPIIILALCVVLLISIIGLKAYKTEVGYELTKSKSSYSKVLMKNKKLKSMTLKLKSHERIESHARKNSMKFPSQRDIIKIKNE